MDQNLPLDNLISIRNTTAMLNLSKESQDSIHSFRLSKENTRQNFSRFWLSWLDPLILILVLLTLYMIWFSNLSMWSVPDEGYTNNASCALSMISTFLLWILWWSIILDFQCKRIGIEIKTINEIFGKIGSCDTEY